MAQPVTLHKLIILYMLNEAEAPLSASLLSEFILDREYTSYFHFQVSIADLTETGFLKKSTSRNMTYYTLTEEGCTTLGYFQEEISPAIRDEVRNYLREKGCEIRRKQRIIADYYRRSPSEYMVRCQVKEKGSSLFDLTILVPSKEAAETMCNHWEQKCQEIYAQIMETLL